MAPSRIIATLVLISNGNRTEWSPIRSAIIRVITKSDDRAAGVRFVKHELSLARRRSVLLIFHIFVCKIGNRLDAVRGKKIQTNVRKSRKIK